MLIRDVELARDGELAASGERTRADLRIRNGRIVALAPRLDRLPDEPVVEGQGGALLPGLHDHHIHLLALAASLESVRCGPPDLSDARGLGQVLAAATPRPDGWIRGFGYHESVAGELDADRLEAIAPGRSLRIQHRSGALWIVSRRGLAQLRLEGRLADDLPAGIERDARGRATGRLYRVDAWLRERLGGRAAPDLSAVGSRLASFGVTGATDATPSNDADELRLFSAALADGALRQRLELMGPLSLPRPAHPCLRRGAVKQVLDESGPLDPDDLAARIRAARASGRATAVHCVTRAELVVALAAFAAAGVADGDRIEHASIAPPELADQIARLALTVVTQPHFVRERGDAYLRDVQAVDRPWLYRCQGLIDSGVALGGGTDAPFGDPDPWRAMQAAVDRRSAGGAILGRDEALSPERALALFTTPAAAPGGAPRRIAPGEPADLCLLDCAWRFARDRLASDAVAATWTAGQLSHRRGEAQ